VIPFIQYILLVKACADKFEQLGRPAAVQYTSSHGHSEEAHKV